MKNLWVHGAAILHQFQRRVVERVGAETAAKGKHHDFVGRNSEICPCALFAYAFIAFAQRVSHTFGFFGNTEFLLCGLEIDPNAIHVLFEALYRKTRFRVGFMHRGRDPPIGGSFHDRPTGVPAGSDHQIGVKFIKNFLRFG